MKNKFEFVRLRANFLLPRRAIFEFSNTASRDSRPIKLIDVLADKAKKKILDYHNLVLITQFCGAIFYLIHATITKRVYFF